jgi:pyrroline-5-carboxylate reductase
VRLAVLGTGNIGSALIRGVVAHMGEGNEVCAWDSRAEALEGLPPRVRRQEPSTWFASGADPDTVLVAVKPSDAGAAMSMLGKLAAGPGVLWVSVAAGVTIDSLELALGGKRRVCRVMPNTPAVVGKSASAFACNAMCDSGDVERVKALFGAVGTTVQVPEKLMNAVTGLSGSGPAYVYLFIEALIEGGVCAGLPYDTARQLAAQTVLGAAEMVAATTRAPAELKAAVMSPGGTTARGLMALEKSGMKYGVIQAVLDATRRAEELGR